MFDLKYHYTIKRKEFVLQMIDDFRCMQRKDMLARMDKIKDACLATVQSALCLPCERAFFRDIISIADNHNNTISDMILMRVVSE